MEVSYTNTKIQRVCLFVCCSVQEFQRFLGGQLFNAIYQGVEQFHIHLNIFPPEISERKKIVIYSLNTSIQMFLGRKISC